MGAKRSLPAAATINWVLKDGLGRLGRLTVATRFGESFDSDLKVRLLRCPGQPRRCPGSDPESRSLWGMDSR